MSLLCAFCDRFLPFNGVSLTDLLSFLLRFITALKEFPIINVDISVRYLFKTIK